MNSLGVKVESYSSLLSSVLLNKLPEEIQLLVSRKVPEKDWRLTSLLEVFEEELQARERVTSEVTRSARNGRQTSIPTGATLFSGVYRGTGCCYCEQSHSPKDCRVVTQVEARRQILKKAGRCFMCLRAGHISKECHSKIRCSKCGKRHHNTICFGEKNEGKPAGMNEGATSVQQGVHNSSKGPNTSEANGSKLNANAPSFPPQ